MQIIGMGAGFAGMLLCVAFCAVFGWPAETALGGFGFLLAAAMAAFMAADDEWWMAAATAALAAMSLGAAIVAAMM